MQLIQWNVMVFATDSVKYNGLCSWFKLTMGFRNIRSFSVMLTKAYMLPWFWMIISYHIHFKRVCRCFDLVGRKASTQWRVLRSTNKTSSQTGWGGKQAIVLVMMQTTVRWKDYTEDDRYVMSVMIAIVCFRWLSSCVSDDCHRVSQMTAIVCLRWLSSVCVR